MVDTVHQAIQLLDTLPPDALTYEPFRNAVIKLFERSESSLEELVHESRSKRRRIEGSTNEKVNDFLTKSFPTFTNKERRSIVPIIVKAVEIIEETAAETGDKFLTNGIAGIGSRRGSVVSTRQKGALELFGQYDRDSLVVEAHRRIALLRVFYEVELCARDLDVRLEGTANRTKLAECEFARLANADPGRVRSLRRLTRAYRVFLDHESGLGFIVLLGQRGRALFEQRMTTSIAKLFLQFCEEKHTAVMASAALLQPEATTILTESLQRDGVDSAELHEGGHIFSRHFPPPPAQTQTLLTRLNTSVDVASFCGAISLDTIPLLGAEVYGYPASSAVLVQQPHHVDDRRIQTPVLPVSEYDSLPDYRWEEFIATINY